jgi:hypothetical protein
MVHYRFHPHHGLELEVVCRPRHADGSITIVDPVGAPLKVPAWMVSPGAGRFSLAKQASVATDALMELSDLLSPFVEQVSEEH